jgi:hypothetical protein
MGKTYNITVDGQNRVGGDDYNTRIDYSTIGSQKAVKQAPVTAIKTADYTLTDTDRYIIVNGSGAVTLTLPNAASWPGREIFVKTIAAQAVNSASSNVKPAASNTAGTAIVTGTAGLNCMMVSDGSHWVVMAT